MLGHGVPSAGAAAEGRAPRTTTPAALCVPRRLPGDVRMRAGGPAGPELPLPWCPARRRRRHGAARGGAAPQRAGPARPRGARLQGNDVSVTSRERRHCPRAAGVEGARGAERVPGRRRGRGAPGVGAPGSSGRPSAERSRARSRGAAAAGAVDAPRGVRPARPGARGKVTAAAAPALGAGP